MGVVTKGGNYGWGRASARGRGKLLQISDLGVHPACIFVVCVKYIDLVAPMTHTSAAVWGTHARADVTAHHQPLGQHARCGRRGSDGGTVRLGPRTPDYAHAPSDRAVKLVQGQEAGRRRVWVRKQVRCRVWPHVILLCAFSSDA